MKRVLMILAWTTGAFFGSGLVLAMIVGFCGGITFGVCYQLHYDVHGYLTAHHSSLVLFGVIFRILCALIAVTVFILALRGRLPGTRPLP
jgi:hypothetical protein